MAPFYKVGSSTPRHTMQSGDILINTNTFSPSHCGIIVENLDVIHATNKEMKKHDMELWGSKADVFRAAVNLSPDEAKKVSTIADEILISATYGLARAAFQSTFASHGAGSGLQKRLAKYRERLKSHQGVVKHVYCSELVILSYQLAFDEAEKHRLFIPLDGKHTWPSTLRRHLKGSIHWQYMGEFEP